jgi:elongation factor Ts
MSEKRSEENPMDYTMDQLKDLRERTGAGVMACKKALAETGGDVKAAAEILRKENLAQAAKREGRVASQGLVESYIHPGGRVGVLVELNCETDFVARTDEFRNLAHDLAIQVAASRPIAVGRDDVPADLLENEKKIYMEQAANEGKPPAIAEKVAEGRVKKFYAESVLLDQVFVRDLDKSQKRTIHDLMQEKIALLGENLVIRRFSRFELGSE